MNMYSEAAIRKAFNKLFDKLDTDTEAIWAIFVDDMGTPSTPVAGPKQETPQENSLHFPKTIALCREQNIRLYLDGCKVHCSLAGRWSLVSPSYGGGYFGSFDDTGLFKPTVACKEEFIKQLQDIEENGVEAAKRIGLLTGSCCVCGRTLTNEDSIAGGIGPICAGKFGAYRGSISADDI